MQQADRELDQAERLLSVACTAKRLGVKSRTIRRWIHSGKIPAVVYPSGYYGIALSVVVKICSGQLRPTADNSPFTG